MSAGLLYHILGVRGYRLVKEKIVNGGMEFHIALDRSKVCCPECGSMNVWFKRSRFLLACTRLRHGDKRRRLVFSRVHRI